MKTLSQYIYENNFHTNEVFNKIESIKNDDDMDNTVEYIVKSGKKEPDICDDSKEFEAIDYFDFWEDNFGRSDDMYEVIERFCNGNNIVIGWKSVNSFNDLNNIVPEFINDIADTWKSKVVQHKLNCTATTWEKILGEHKCTLLKLNMHANHNGAERMEYWYLFIIEE